MPKGSFSVEVMHFCGELIRVQIDWQEYYATRTQPPEYDEQHAYFVSNLDHDTDKCPKCGINLFCDDLFQTNIELAADKLVDRGEQTPYDEADYDPDPPGFDDMLWHSLSHTDEENPSRGRP